jgi:hypothetical protein
MIDNFDRKAEMEGMDDMREKKPTILIEIFNMLRVSPFSQLKIHSSFKMILLIFSDLNMTTNDIKKRITGINKFAKAAAL